MDLIGVPPVRRVGLEHGEQDLGVAAHGREDVVEVVGHAAGEAAHRLHALRVLELLLEPLVLGDVVGEGDHARPAGELGELERVDGVDGAAIARVHAHLELSEEARRHRLREALQVGRIEAEPQLEERLADHLLAAQPRDAQEAVADVEVAVVLEVEDADDHGAVVEDLGEQGLLLAQDRLGAVALGDVADDADQEALAVELEVARADLAGELAAVASDVPRLELDAGGGGARHLIADLVVRRWGAEVTDVALADLVERVAVRGQGRAIGVAQLAARIHEQDDVARLVGDCVDAPDHAPRALRLVSYHSKRPRAWRSL